jgi:hypothetical protein
MDQLMGDQTPAGERSRNGLSSTEHNVLSHGVGLGAYLPRRLPESRSATP